MVTGLLVVFLLATCYLREVIFLSIHAAATHHPDVYKSHMKVPAFLSGRSETDLIIYKYLFTAIFSAACMTLTLLAIHTLFAKKKTSLHCLFAYGMFILAIALTWLAEKWVFSNQGYPLTVGMLHILQSPIALIVMIPVLRIHQQATGTGQAAGHNVT
ncbi:MAG: hypothetical protein H6585_04190 [Flavobacteriales bacterium]|nr:hypothetical protein [Flavobacteriales bacterium]